MAEGIKIDGRMRLHAKFFQKELSSFCHIADHRFAGGHITVRLNVPASHDMPFSFLYLLLNPFKQIRFVFFYPLIQNRFIMIKSKARKLIGKTFRHPESRQCLRTAFLPSPKPYRVQMGIADQVNFSHFCSVPFSPLSLILLPFPVPSHRSNAVPDQFLPQRHFSSLRRPIHPRAWLWKPHPHS